MPFLSWALPQNWLSTTMERDRGLSLKRGENEKGQD